MFLMDGVESEGLLLVSAAYGQPIRILHMNEAAQRMALQFKDDELIRILQASIDANGGAVEIESAALTNEGIEYQTRITVNGKQLEDLGRPKEWLFHIRYCPNVNSLLERIAQLEFSLNSVPQGIATYVIDTESRESRLLLKSRQYLDLMKLTAAEVEADGLLAIGRRIASCDREHIDPRVNEGIMKKSQVDYDFRIIHENSDHWRLCNATFRSGLPGTSQVIMTTAITDYTDGARERDRAERAVATSANLACLMDQLFEIQFEVDETLRLVPPIDEIKVIGFFGGDQVPWSLHDVLADADSSNRLVKYLASRPVLSRKHCTSVVDGEPPSLITVTLAANQTHGQRQVQIFAATAFLDNQENLSRNGVNEHPPPIMEYIAGRPAVAGSAASRRQKRFLIAIRIPKRSANDSSRQAKQPLVLCDVSVLIGRALRGLIMDSLTSIATAPVSSLTIEFISPTFSPRNVAWCVEEALLLLPLDMHESIKKVSLCGNFGEANRLLSPYILARECGSIARKIFCVHLLMTLAANQTGGRLAALRTIENLISRIPVSLSIKRQVHLELATMLTREACTNPTVYSEEPVRSWLRAVVVGALSPAADSGDPGIYFLTILFADYCFKSKKFEDGRDLLMSAAQDMRRLKSELSSVKQMLVIATHNLAVDALRRGDAVTALSHIIRLKSDGAAQASPLPPQCIKLIESSSAVISSRAG